MECPACAMMIDDDSTLCPVCGYEFPKQSTGIKWVAIVLLMVLLGYFLLQLLRKG